MLLGAIVTGTDSFISLSSVSSLAYREASDFWALIGYPATLPNLLYEFWQSWGGVFWVFQVRYHVIGEEGEFDYFFADLNAFYFFLSLDC